LAWLGRSRVARLDAGVFALGTAMGWCRPWFEVAYDNGRIEKTRKHGLEPMLLFSPADFFDPRLFFFDFGDFNPSRNPGWVAGMHLYLDTQRVLLPRCWLGPLGPGAGPGEAGAGAIGGDIARHRADAAARCEALLIELSGEALRASTLENLRYAAYKALWWLACMGYSLPPTSEAVAGYLAFLSDTVDTRGSIADARGAIGYLATVNSGRG
jgi:hypothetical protein